MHLVQPGVLVVGVFKTRDERHLRAGAVAGPIGRKRIGISAAELFGAPGPIDHSGPEAVECLFVEIAPAIGRVKADEEAPPGADQLRGQWGGKLDKSLLIRTAREIAAFLASQLPDTQVPAAAGPAPRERATRGPASPGAAAQHPRPGTGRDMTGPQPTSAGGHPPTGSTAPRPATSAPSQPHPAPLPRVPPMSDEPSAPPAEARLPPRGRHHGPPAQRDAAVDRLGLPRDPPSATVSGGPAATPGDPGGW